MSTQSMTDVAHTILEQSKQSISFKDLWNQVRVELGLNDTQAAKKMSQFYTNLTLDGRFLSQKDNMWDLKKRFKFEETYVDTSAIEIDESDVDDEFKDEEEEEEPAEKAEEF